MVRSPPHEPRRRAGAALDAIRALIERARQERSSPKELGLSIAVGVFVGCTPFLWLHMWIALGLATLLKLNRLWAFLGSRISFWPLFGPIAFVEIETAHRLRTGTWAPLAPATVISQGFALLTDWCLGALLVGGCLASAAGLSAYAMALRQQRDGTTRRTRAECRPASSGSPRSGPPAPNP